MVTDPSAFAHGFETVLNRGDMERSFALHDEEAVLRAQSNEMHSGAEAVRVKAQRLIAAGANISNTFRHGDTALIVVDHVLRLTPPDGSPVAATGTATNVIPRHPEKSWRMIIAILPEPIGIQCSQIMAPARWTA